MRPMRHLLAPLLVLSACGSGTPPPRVAETEEVAPPADEERPDRAAEARRLLSALERIDLEDPADARGAALEQLRALELSWNEHVALRSLCAQGFGTVGEAERLQAEARRGIEAIEATGEEPTPEEARRLSDLLEASNAAIARSRVELDQCFTARRELELGL